MLQAGAAVKVTIHFNRDTGAEHGFLADEILSFLQKQGVTGATVIAADGGYGFHRQLHAVGSGDVSGLHLPSVLYFIEEQSRFEAIRKPLLALVTDGLVEVQATTILKNVASSEKVIS